MRAPAHPALPTGTVTFLFTDIEGSTRLLTALGRTYDRVISAHADILRRAITANAGVEVSTEGDAFFATFSSAINAVRAAADAQRAFAAKVWPDGSTLRVRMGLHTGEGRLVKGDYVGLDVHRAARVAAAGHGGQVLLTDATRGLVAQGLPEGIGLRDLAEHQLKDLPARERIWQLDIDGLQTDFPMIRSLDSRPNNLPVPAGDLIGRERELEDVSKLVREHRLVTLTGVGGTGKTRLAIAAAQSLLPEFADGGFFIALEDARDRQAVVAAIAAALRVREKAGRDLEESVKATLAGGKMLLVLDNFEQVLSAAPLVAELLAGSPGLRIVVTSRSPVHLSAEQEYGVEPLGLPDLAHLPPIATLADSASVALFVERARTVQADFALTDANAPAIAEICSRLDGLPLAIELAAAHVKVLTPRAILDRLTRSLPLPIDGAQDVPARQRAVRSTMEWSYELLTEPEQQLFRRVAVFAGGWSIEACERVCNPDGDLGKDTLTALIALADKSLIRAGEDGGESRFGMLQVVRDFASEQLESSPESVVVHQRHAAWMRDFTEQAEPELVRTELRRWQRQLRRDEENLRAALHWTLANNETETGLRIAGAVWRFWHYWAEFREGRRWLESLLGVSTAPSQTLPRAKALRALGSILYWQGDAEGASESYEQALDIYRRLGDEQEIADALFDSAWSAVGRGDVSRAAARALEARDHYRLANDRGGVARSTAFVATGAFLMGGGGSQEEAISGAQSAVELSRELGRLHDVADWLGSVSFVYFRAGDLPRSLDAFRKGMRAWREMENVGMLPFMKLGAALELGLGHPERAARLAAVAARAVDEMGGELPDAMIGDIDPMEEARALLPADVFARELDAGRTMTFDEAVAFALDEPP